MLTRRECLIGLGSLATGAALGGVAGRVWTGRQVVDMLEISSLTPTALSDSAALIAQDGYSVSSPFARLVLETEATTLRLTTYNDSKDNFSDITKFGVWVDGVYLTSFNPSGEGLRNFYLGMDTGLKTIEFVSGPQSLPTGQSLVGSYIVSVTANKPMTQVLAVEDERLLIYGDSIAIGDGAGTAVQSAAWPIQVREDFAGSVELEAWGYRSLYDDCNTSELRAAFVAKIAARDPTIVWLAIGGNDYGLNKWSAASFGTAYAAVLDDLHTALPSAAIYAQTPLVRATETANGSGSTLGDYRSQIATACSTREWATLVDGTGFLTTDDLPDGVHPPTTGHGLIATAVLSELS